MHAKSIPPRGGRLLVAVAVAICAASVAMIVQSSSPLASGDGAPVPGKELPADPPAPGLAVAARTAVVRAAPASDAKATSAVRAGVLLPFGSAREGFLNVMTPCERRGWVSTDDVDIYPRAPAHPGRLAGATVVIDPGHGGRESGAVGRTGLQEKDVNLDIARRLSAAIRGARVIITRDGDFVAGLTYRTHIASAVGAQLFVSVHNNAQADTGSEHPGTETYYQHESAPSRRLAGLTYEELFRVLDEFHVSWRSARDPGAKPRVNERGTDYYGVLRTSTVPAVITEGVYIDNPPEEALLRREDVRDDMALALSRAITRFLTTDDSGSGFVTKPLPRATGPRFRLPSSCTDPA